jgi:hypothetical protein
MSKKSGRVGKYMPRFDGPYKIIAKHAECSTYTLDLPNEPNIFPTFHASEIEPYIGNDDELFPAHKKTIEPTPITNEYGEEEHFIDKIIDERTRGRGRQYLVRFIGGDERWLPGREVANCAALDLWLAHSTD